MTRNERRGPFAYTPKGAIIRLIFAGLLAGLRRHVLGEVGFVF
jgi:hypothetical protein